MPHLSENCSRLDVQTRQISALSQLQEVPDEASAAGVYLLHLPAGRTDRDASISEVEFAQIALFCGKLHSETTVCILTTPPNAARLIPYLETCLKFQLWIAVKLSSDALISREHQLPEQHVALLVLTRYHGSLKHTKTRIGYTYCPACRKTTKDYGGKKHVYHEYGTLMSDVWRDIECSPGKDIAPVVDRLRDLFGLQPYSTLRVLDLRSCIELRPALRTKTLSEERLPLEWQGELLPLESRLLNVDCLEGLKSLPDNSVDFCFADPPYNIQKQYDHWNDDLEMIAYFAWCDQWLSELARVLKPGRTLAVLNIPLWAVRHYQHLCMLLDFQNWIAWEALSLPVRMIMPAHYGILCFSKGMPRSLTGLTSNESAPPDDLDALTVLKECYCVRSSCIAKRRRLNESDMESPGDLWYDIHRLKHNSRRVDHPCQLPPQLMSRLYALFTRHGELILDCFNGAGTSTLVAQKMKRRFIGMELSSQYHDLALKRHEQLLYGEDPFGKRETVPNSKNSRVERLPRQKYQVSKKVLQMDVKRIAQQIGHVPTREEVLALSIYPIEYFERYFISWGEVCAAARTTGMSELPQDRDTEQTQLNLML